MIRSRRVTKFTGDGLMIRRHRPRLPGDLPTGASALAEGWREHCRKPDIMAAPDIMAVRRKAVALASNSLGRARSCRAACEGDALGRQFNVGAPGMSVSMRLGRARSTLELSSQAMACLQATPTAASVNWWALPLSRFTERRARVGHRGEPVERRHERGAVETNPVAATGKSVSCGMNRCVCTVNPLNARTKGWTYAVNEFTAAPKGRGPVVNQFTAVANRWRSAVNEFTTVANRWISAVNEFTAVANRWRSAVNEFTTVANRWSSAVNEFTTVANRWSSAVNQFTAVANR
jgi:hypothetical protein